MRCLTVNDLAEEARLQYSFRPEFADALSKVLTFGSTTYRLDEMKKELEYLIDIVDFMKNQLQKGEDK